jgi:acetyltransferase-like isoleucine patch superfamily enzyme
MEFKSKGKNVFIHDGALIKRPYLCEIGNHVAIDNATISTALDIGDYVHISPYVSIIGGENGILHCKGFNNIMSGAKIICGSDRFDGSGLFGALIPNELKGKQIIEPVVMEEFSNVGTNAIVLPGARLRKGVLLTAGSLLIGDTEEWGIYQGNPAILKKKIDSAKTLENAKKLGYEF